MRTDDACGPGGANNGDASEGMSTGQSARAPERQSVRICAQCAAANAGEGPGDERAMSGWGRELREAFP
jgi:hypothetical protein